MMRAALRGLAALLTTFAIATAQAAPIRLDDSLTHTVPPNVQMQWRPMPLATDGSGAVEAWLRVNVRIDTRPVLNRTGRVYLVLDRDEASLIEAVWTTQGRLQAGRVVSGERALVFAGEVSGATLEDQFLMRLRSQADWQRSTRRLQFHFEFDVD